MKFCSQCGQLLEQRIPEGDNRLRYVCAHCQTIHYQNPNIVAGCLPVYGDKILLCKRAIEPRSGLWTLPAGFMENNETVEQAAMRESMEEANANVELEQLYSVFSLPHVNQVYMMFRGKLLDLDFSPGAESEDVALFAPDMIPWDALAFPTINHTLEFLLEDDQRGEYRLHTGDIIKQVSGYRFVRGPV